MNLVYWVRLLGLDLIELTQMGLVLQLGNYSTLIIVTIINVIYKIQTNTKQDK